MKHRSLGHALQEMATTQRLRGLLVVAIAVPTLIFTMLAWHEHERAARSAINALEQASRIVHEHALKVFEINEVVLDRFVEMLGDRSTKALSRDEFRLHSTLAQTTDKFAQIRNVMLWDEDGRPVASSRYYPVRRDMTIADRAYFIRHKKDGVPVSINEPVDGRLGGDRVFNISRLRRHADSRFAGVVSVSFSPQYFSEFYRRVVGEEHHFAIALVRQDGEVVARYPLPAAAVKLTVGPQLMTAINESAAQGVVTGISAVDGEPRHVAFRKVEPYPLYVVVSRTTASVYGEWRRDMAVVALLFVPGVAVVILAIGLALRKAQQEHEAVLQHHEEETRRRSAEDQLRQLQKFEAMGQLTGGLAHDFNNLLHIVSINAAAIGLMPTSRDISGRLAAINQTISSGQALVAHMLAFGRKRSLTLEIVNLASAVPRMCDLARHSLPRTINLVWAMDGGVWDVKADRSELQLAIINMAVNSRDAMPGGGVIEVRVRNIPSDSSERIEAHLPDRDFVAVSVSDEGTGIPEELLHRVFEPLFTTKQETKGSGLGLSRVYAYAIELGGMAIARNGPKGGAVVTVYIPRFYLSAPANVLRSEADASGYEPEMTKSLEVRLQADEA